MAFNETLRKISPIPTGREDPSCFFTGIQRVAMNSYKLSTFSFARVLDNFVNDRIRLLPDDFNLHNFKRV